MLSLPYLSKQLSVQAYNLLVRPGKDDRASVPHKDTASHRCGDARRLGIADRQTFQAADRKITPGFRFHRIPIESSIFGGRDAWKEPRQRLDDCGISPAASADDPLRGHLGE